MGQADYTSQEKPSRFVVGCDTLKEGECVTDTIGRSRRKLGWIQKRVDGDDLLQQRGHDT